MHAEFASASRTQAARKLPYIRYFLFGLPLFLALPIYLMHGGLLHLEWDLVLDPTLESLNPIDSLWGSNQHLLGAKAGNLFLDVLPATPLQCETCKSEDHKEI